MYSVNTIPPIELVRSGRFRTGLELLGAKNGNNCTFTVPGGHKFVHNPPFLSIRIYWNGLRLSYKDDYSISEGGGSGSGYDTVTLVVAPELGDHIVADYVTHDCFLPGGLLVPSES